METQEHLLRGFRWDSLSTPFSAVRRTPIFRLRDRQFGCEHISIIPVRTEVLFACRTFFGLALPKQNIRFFAHQRASRVIVQNRLKLIVIKNFGQRETQMLHQVVHDQFSKGPGKKFVPQLGVECHGHLGPVTGVGPLAGQHRHGNSHEIQRVTGRIGGVVPLPVATQLVQKIQIAVLLHQIFGRFQGAFVRGGTKVPELDVIRGDLADVGRGRHRKERRRLFGLDRT